MVRKIMLYIVAVLMIVAATCGTASAATHQVYDEGQISSTYVTYFKDIISGIGFNENYVAFRSGQYSYTMVVGDLEYDGDTFTLADTGTEYVFSTGSSGYNQQYKYNVNTIDNFSVSVGDNIIYSDLGQYPQLMERGAKYEMLSAVLMCIMCISVVIRRIFYHR